MSDKKEKKRLGAPTKYTEDIPDRLVQYFKNFETFVFMDKEFPKIKTIEGFCTEINIAKSTFHEWRKKYPMLSNAWERAKTMQANQIHNLTANRIIDGNYGKLLAVNCTDLKDKVEKTIDATDSSIQLAYALKEKADG